MKHDNEKHNETDLNQIGLLVSDHIDAMLAYWDKDLVCRFANKAYLEWFGKNRDEMIGKITLKELLGPLYELNLAYINGALGGERQTFEREILTPLHGTKHSLANYYPHILDGEVRGFFVHVADVTQIKNLEKELIALLEYEKQLNEIKSSFVSTASHELRTPLSTITSSMSLLERYNQSGDYDKMEKHFKKIRASVENLVGILNNYLSLDKIEQNKIKIEYVNFNLPDFINEIMQEVGGILKEGQKIQYVHKGSKEVKQEKKILHNILLNLLSNAIKYSDKNKEIFLTTEVSKNKILLNVRDNGIGISETDQANLFKTFFRANNVVNIEGSGLGLTIVKRYVELIGGRINLESKIDEGTTVNIELSNILS
ncbi:PAS domain-containing sensor histidine kinase [Cytophaga aurantiaca]|uniref:sensor histidine kinase n=1 Tax=Cytophaga aurantiaca TaxID=29530 RepID=UPI00036899E9|nr:PAS domain-containing sensor histidine kinase [Cytophaga aurantiaca]